jgi:hypothetical protein
MELVIFMGYILWVIFILIFVFSKFSFSFPSFQYDSILVVFVILLMELDDVTNKILICLK